MPRETRPAPSASTEYHLYQLENLFATLHDLWQAKRRGIRVGHRWLQAVTGFGDARAVPEAPNAFPITLEVGSRLCNSTLRSLGTDSRERPSAHLEADILRMRELLIAIHDMTETAGSRSDYPLEQAAARDHLAQLIGLPPETAGSELTEAALALGAGLATAAIGRCMRSEGLS